MPCRTLWTLVVAVSFSAPLAARQGATPQLNRTEREMLQTVVAAVDAAAGAPESADVEWQTHLLRTSDGAHYVAFTATPPAALAPQLASTFYVRLATRQDPQASPLAERSAVMEWLKGMRSDPLVAQKRRGIAFGEMPVFGAGSIATRGPGQQAGDLALLALERERAREQKAAAEKARQAALEGTASRPRDAVFPFEDFSVNVKQAAGELAPALVRRSITAGPGEYDLYIAWAAPPPRGRPPTVHVVKRTLSLPPATSTELTLSSIILADEFATRTEPYPPDQQSSHPYAIGPMEILPARDETFTNDERLALIFQVVNARANEAGKPDVAIAFQLLRVTPAGEQSVGMLNPQYYNATTLPPDFDLTKGHPIFAAMAAPLKTLARGEYRLRVGATDKLATRMATRDVAFRVVATPATLLATAPTTVAFRREALLDVSVLREVTARLRQDTMTPPMVTALDAAGEAKFIELLRDDQVADRERPARAALRGIGLFALGDPRMACTMLRQAAQEAAEPALKIYLGACRASEGNDRDAVVEWQSALDQGIPPAILVPSLVDAYLRLGDTTRAADAAKRLVTGGVPEPSIARALAAISMAQGNEVEAIRIVEPALTARPTDLDAQYVLLHALFASFVHQKGPGATPEGRERFHSVARSYIEAKGRHATFVSEWLEVMR